MEKIGGNTIIEKLIAGGFGMSKEMLAMGIIIFIGGLLGMFLNRKISRKMMIFMGAVYLAAGACAFFIIEHYYEIPKSDVEIILTDLDEKADSVFLSHVLIDGEEYTVEHMKSGNWLWQNNSFGWKNAAGTVLEEIDKDVIVEIPIGYIRTLSFNADGDTGKIQIAEGGDTAEQLLNRGENNIQLKGTPKKQVYLAKIIKLAMFSILFALFILVINLMRKHWDAICVFCRKNGFYIILFFLSLLSLFFMWRYADDESFWYDEVYTLGFLQGGEKTNSMWIVSMLMRAWSFAAPYGQEYLLLIEIMAVVCTVYFIGLIGRRICDEQCGIIAAILVGFSECIWLYAAFEFRSYAFLLLFSVTTFYFLLIRNAAAKHKYFFSVLYGVNLLLLMDSHEYGKVLVVCYLAVDVVLLIGKKINVKYLITWIIPFMYGIYWIFNNEVGHLWNNYSWPENPNIEIVADTFMILCNKQWILFGLFLCGVVYIMKLLIDYLKNSKTFVQIDKYLYPLWLIVGVFACSIIYSNYINPQNSLYLPRYFISVVAYIYIIIAVTVSKIIDYIKSVGIKCLNRNMVTVCIAMLLIFNGWQIYRTYPQLHNNDYRGCAEWLKNQEDIYDKDVVIVSTESKENMDAFLYFFYQGKDSHTPQIIIDKSFNLDRLQSLSYRKGYVVSFLPGVQALPEHTDDYKSVMLKEEYGIKIYEKKMANKKS